MNVDVNALLSALLGGASVYAAIKADIALLKYQYRELKREFEEHVKKATH